MADLVIDGLTVEYGSATGEVTRPLGGFAMVSPAGSLELLLGPSGGGKTTLLSCLAAILSPAQGTVSFGGVTVSELVERSGRCSAGAPSVSSSGLSTWSPA